MKIIGCVCPPLTWDISQIIINILFLVVIVCVLNQSYGHWLLFHVLHVAITMTLKLKEEFLIAPSMDNLIEDSFGVALELYMITLNIKKEGCEVLYVFFSFLMKYKEKNICNMFFWMLDPRFKNFWLVFIYWSIIKCFHL